MKEEKYLKKVKEYFIQRNADKSLHYIKLLKDKSSYMLLFKAFSYEIKSDFVKSFNVINKIINDENSLFIHKLIAKQLLVFIIKKIKKDFHGDELIPYKEIINNSDSYINTVETLTNNNKDIIMEFIEENDYFKYIYVGSILFTYNTDKIINKIIDYIKEDKFELYYELLSEEFDKIDFFDKINNFLLLYVDDKELIDEKYKEIKEDKRFVINSLYGRYLYEIENYDEAEKLFEEIINNDNEKNILVLKYYVYSLYKLNKLNKINNLRNKIDEIDDLKDIVIEIDTIEYIKNNELDKALENINLLIKNNSENINAIKLKNKVLFKQNKIEILIDFNKELFYEKNIINKKPILNTLFKIVNVLYYNRDLTKDQYEKKELYIKIIKLCTLILNVSSEFEKIKVIKYKLIDILMDRKRNTNYKKTLSEKIEELRFTEDIFEIKKLANKFYKEMKWEKALYCFEAILIYEPEEKYILKLKEKLFERCKQYKLNKQIVFDIGKDEIIAVDTNFWLSKIFKNVKTDKGDFMIFNPFEEKSKEIFAKISNYNQMVILPTNLKEINNHFEASKLKIKASCKDTKFGKDEYNEIINKIQKRINDFKEKYYFEIETKENLELINDFYYERINVLENLTLNKYPKDKNKSRCIRKLVQRGGVYPELNDRKILLEAICLMKLTNKQVGILSFDQDFTLFTKDIYDKFKIKIYDGLNIKI